MVNVSYLVDLSNIISGVTSRNVKGGVRLKPREVDLEDAVVEDTPPSKIAKKSLKCMRPQENDGVEGFSKIRTRSGSAAREIKGKHPQLDVEESAQKRTRSRSVAQEIKAKHPRARKHRNVEGSSKIKAKHPRARKHQNVNEGEIRETAYRASLNGIKTLIEELNLSDEHKKIMKNTPFWKIFKSIIENKLTCALCRKSDKMIIRIINAYDPDTGGFKLGSKTVRITRDDIFSIFGITGGSEKVSFKYGSRDGVGMVSRGSIEAERLSGSTLKELVKEYAVRNNKAGREDFHHDDPRRVSRCVVVLLYWLCEHTNLVKPLHPEESLGIIKWRTMDMVKAFREVSLKELKTDQVVSRQPNVHDTHMFYGNIDIDSAVLSREKIRNEGRNGSAEDVDGAECSKRNSPIVTSSTGVSARNAWTPKVGCDLENTGVDVLNEGTVHTEYGVDGIGELREHIVKMEHQMKQNEEMHARELAIKDQEIERLNETVFVLLSEKSQLLGELTETVVHGVTQNYKSMAPEEQERSMVTRLKTRMRKETQKKDYDYGRKRKRSTSESAKVDEEDPKKVIDVENFIAGPEKGPFKPKPIRNLRTNAVYRLLSSGEKDKIKKMWDEVYTSTIIWSGTVAGCSVFVEDIRQVMVDSALSGNVIDAYVEVLSIEQGSMPDEMQGDCTQVMNKTVYVFTCSFLTMLGCKCPIERKKVLENMMPRTASYQYVMFPIHFGYHWTLLILDNEEGSWKFYNSMMERTGVDAHCKAAEQLKNQVESYWKNARGGLLTTQDCEPIVTVQDCPQQEDSSLNCGVIVSYIIRQYYRSEEIEPTLRKAACHKMRSEIIKAFLSGAGQFV
ncbi:hypothetical protein RHGRI_000314 [Rhododendron griersonianum]|uniref:Ubiquitin-like protease family profile domain-containing protein n=1 Tax=Rhododendron griersonianum TaxID=479676 RepID=A0AAV6LH18_9ERIC|nr:hypothetical protein RHGRI_000314 [Rhododendron griersonianum]